MAFHAVGKRVFLHRPRDKRSADIFGSARVVGIHPDLKDHRFLWVEFTDLIPFGTALPLSAIKADSTESEFHRYSKGIWVLHPSEFNRLTSMIDGVGRYMAEPDQVLFSNPSEERIYRNRRSLLRRKMLRVRMLELYGASCPFTGLFAPSLDGLRFEINVGHVFPLGLGGPDILENIIPMSGFANWAWDEGIISLTNAGTILIAERAHPETRAKIRAGAKAPFPKDARYWPKAEYLEMHRDLLFGKGPSSKAPFDAEREFHQP